MRSKKQKLMTLLYFLFEIILIFSLVACETKKEILKKTYVDKNLTYSTQVFSYPDGAVCQQRYLSFNPPNPQYLVCDCENTDKTTFFYSDPMDYSLVYRDMHCISQSLWAERNKNRQNSIAEKKKLEAEEKRKAEEKLKKDQIAAEKRKKEEQTEMALTRKFCVGAPGLDRTVREILSSHWGVHPNSITVDRVSYSNGSCSGAFYTPVGVRYCSGLSFNGSGSIRYSLMLCPK
jgi:hypothetical protein